MPAENEDRRGWELYEEPQESRKGASEGVLFTKVVCIEPIFGFVYAPEPILAGEIFDSSINFKVDTIRRFGSGR